EFFDRNRSANRWYFPTESGRLVWKNEKSVATKQVEQETERREYRDGSPKRFSWKLQIGSAGKPPAQHTDGNDKQQQAPGVSERRRIIRRVLQNGRVNDRSQRDRSWNNKRRCDGENHVECSSLLHAP